MLKDKNALSIRCKDSSGTIVFRKVCQPFNEQGDLNDIPPQQLDNLLGQTRNGKLCEPGTLNGKKWFSTSYRGKKCPPHHQFERRVF